MSSALYVGRVGALAIALGIGAVIAGLPGVAWAGPEVSPTRRTRRGCRRPRIPTVPGTMSPVRMSVVAIPVIPVTATIKAVPRAE